MRLDGFFLFLKMSFIDMGLIFKQNYRPAKKIFTREIIHVLFVDIMPVQLNPSLQGRQPWLVAWLTLTVPFPSSSTGLHGSQPSPETQSYAAWQSASKCSLLGCCADSLNSHTPLLIYISSLCFTDLPWDVPACGTSLPDRVDVGDFPFLSTTQ